MWGGQYVTAQTLRLNLDDDPVIFGEALPDGTVSQPYTAWVHNAARDGELASDQGSVPPWLTLSEGQISGTPETAGQWLFVVRTWFTLPDGNPGGYAARYFTLVVND